VCNFHIIVQCSSFPVFVREFFYQSSGRKFCRFPQVFDKNFILKLKILHFIIIIIIYVLEFIIIIIIIIIIVLILCTKLLDDANTALCI